MKHHLETLTLEFSKFPYLGCQHIPRAHNEQDKITQHDRVSWVHMSARYNDKHPYDGREARHGATILAAFDWMLFFSLVLNVWNLYIHTPYIQYSLPYLHLPSE